MYFDNDQLGFPFNHHQKALSLKGMNCTSLRPCQLFNLRLITHWTKLRSYSLPLCGNWNDIVPHKGLRYARQVMMATIFSLSFSLGKVLCKNKLSISCYLVSHLHLRIHLHIRTYICEHKYTCIREQTHTNMRYTQTCRHVHTCAHARINTHSQPYPHNTTTPTPHTHAHIKYTYTYNAISW